MPPAGSSDRNDAFDARNYFNPPPQKVAELAIQYFRLQCRWPGSSLQEPPDILLLQHGVAQIECRAGLNQYHSTVYRHLRRDFASNLPADSNDRTGLSFRIPACTFPARTNFQPRNKLISPPAGITTFQWITAVWR